MLGSLLGYFFFMVVAFAATTGLMIATFSDSTLGKVLRYPRPIVEQTVTSENSRRPLFMLATKEESEKSAPAAEPAKDTNNTNNTSSSDVSVTKTDTEKSKHEKPGYSHKLASRRENYQSRVAFGSPGAFGYRPGLDGQR